MSRLLQVLPRVLGLLVFLLVAFVLFLQIFLNIWLPVLANQRPERFEMGYSLAWMVKPGEIHVRNLEIRQQGLKDQWLLTVDRATVSLDASDLREHRIHIVGALASGATYRWRARLDALAVPLVEPLVELPDGLPIQVPEDATPPIRGLNNPPEPTPESLYRKANPWRVELEDVHIDGIREIWLDDYRFDGDASVSGSLTLEAHEWLEAESVALTISDGRLSRGESTILTGVKAEVGFQFVGTNPEAMAGRSPFSAMSAEVGLTATVPDLTFLDFYLRAAPWLDLRGGLGSLSAGLRVEEGVFMEGSTVSAEVSNIVAGFLSHSIVGDGELHLAVGEVDGQARTTVEVDFLDYSIRRDGDPDPHVRGRGFRLVGTTPDVAVDRPFTSMDLVLTLPEAEIPDVRMYNVYLPQQIGLVLQSGAGTIEGDLRVSTEQGDCSGEVLLNGREVRARLDDLSLGGQVKVHGVIQQGNLKTGEYDISGSSLDLRGIRVRSASSNRDGKDDSDGWWAAVKLPRGAVAVGAPTFLTGTVDLACRDTVPFITIFAERNKLPGWVRGLLNAQPVRGSARIRLADDSFRVSGFELFAGKFEVLLELQRRRQTAGKLFARHGKLSIAVSMGDSKTRVHLFKAKKWYDAEPDPR